MLERTILVMLTALSVGQFGLAMSAREAAHGPSARRKHAVQFKAGDDAKTLTDWLDGLTDAGWTILDCRRANDGTGSYASYGLECILERPVPGGPR